MVSSPLLMARPYVTVTEGLGLYQRLLDGNFAGSTGSFSSVDSLAGDIKNCIYLIGVDSSVQSLQQGLHLVDRLLEQEIVGSKSVVIDPALLYRDDANLIRRMCWNKGILAKQFEDRYVADQLKFFAQAQQYTNACLELDVAAYEGMKAFTAREEEIFLPQMMHDFEVRQKVVYLLDHWHLGSDLVKKLKKKGINYFDTVC